MFFADFFFT